MLLGGFGFLKDYDGIKAAGFDYAELDMPEIEALRPQEFDVFHAHVLDSGLPIPSGARILPIKEPLFFTCNYDRKVLEPYLKSTCRKSGILGVKKILFGNGKARWLVDDNSIKEEAVFIDFLRMLCDIAGENGQEVLIEPLGPKYSNYINTLPEAARIIDAADMPNLFAMADLRHFVWSKEPFEDVALYRQIVHHIHIDYPLSFPARNYPNIQDSYDYGPFFDQLQNYSGTLTVEADIPEDWLSAAQDARDLLQKYLPKRND